MSMSLKKTPSRLFLALIILIGSSATVLSQDVHLTQYYTSNPSLNPAWTGNYDGDIRLTANHRNQWKQIGTPIRTNMFSVEKKLLKVTHEFGFGLLLVNDQVSVFDLSTNKAMLSASIQKEFKGNLIRFGVQGGMVFRSTELSDQTFDSQWNYNTGNFEPATSNGEGELKQSYRYFDFSAGAGWTRVFSGFKASAGYAVFHLNRPGDGFISGARHLPFRHVFNASAVRVLPHQVDIIPHLLYMRTASASDFIMGVNAKKQMTSDLAVLFGTGYRGSTINSDAMMLIAGLSYKRIDFGFSMDFNVSQLSRDSRNKSALEFSIVYTTPGIHPGKITIPCDRY